MSEDFATAMRRALAQTRGSNPAEATAIIQAALNGGAAPNPGGCMPCMGTPRAPMSFGNRASAPVVSMSDGARVETRRHAGPAGARDYRLFVPSPREGGYEGLVVMLHGCTQSPEDFARGTAMDRAAERAGVVVAYPGQTGQHNAQSCWNWFRAGDQLAGQGEAEILAGLAAELGQEFGLAGRTHVAGLSAGGAMAAILIETHPHIFASAGIHSGLPAGAATDLPSAFAAMQGQGRGRVPTKPVIVFHGLSDRTVAPSNGRAMVPGDGIETRHQGGGRSWTRTTAGASELWLVEGAGHAWFGGDPSGSYADAAGPDASSEMLRFFLEQEQAR